jgi:hypothetical protein
VIELFLLFPAPSVGRSPVPLDVSCVGNGAGLVERSNGFYFEFSTAVLAFKLLDITVIPKARITAGTLIFDHIKRWIHYFHPFAI